MLTIIFELRTVIAGCRQVLLLCGSVEERLSKEVVQLEVATEENVLKPLVTILEDDIPSIDKLRRQLHTRTLDMDAAKNRSLSEVQATILFLVCLFVNKIMWKWLHDVDIDR